ncbi:hypothetical protein CY34DRAFT_798549, partial [Suillus luteus UH-Slu-Lm8-n1]
MIKVARKFCIGFASRLVVAAIWFHSPYPSSYKSSHGATQTDAEGVEDERCAFKLEGDD